MSKQVVFTADDRRHFIWNTKDADGNTLPQYMTGEDVLEEYDRLAMVKMGPMASEMSHRLSHLERHLSLASPHPDSFEAYKNVQFSGNHFCFVRTEMVFGCNAYAIKLSEQQGVVAERQAESRAMYERLIGAAAQKKGLDSFIVGMI